MSFDFYEALHSSKLSQEQLRVLCGVSVRTLQRWIEKNDCPAYAQTIIRCYSYSLEWMGGQRWKNSYIDRYENKLWVDGCRRPFSPGEIKLLTEDWPKLHWYYENWIKEQNHPGWTHTPEPDVIQFELPLKLKKALAV